MAHRFNYEAFVSYLQSVEFTDTIGFLVPIVERFAVGYCIFRFVKPFMEKKEWAFLAGAVYSAVMLALYLLPRYPDVYVAYGLGSFSAFLVISRAEQRNYRQKIFLLATFFSLHLFASSMAEILYDNIYDFMLSTEYMAGHQNLESALYAGVCAMYLALEMLFTVIGIWYISRVYVYKYTDLSKKELLMLVIPTFMGAIGYEIMRYYRMFYILEMGTNTGVYDALLFLYCVVSVITIVVVTALYQKMKLKQEERLQAKLLALQIEGIRQHIEQVEGLYQDIHSIKHDMTNHILTIERLYERNQAEEARAYLKRLKEEHAGVTGGIKSGNPVTDVILQELKNEARKRDIMFHSEFCYPTGSGINAFDISVILNNALQNAMESILSDAAKTGNKAGYKLECTDSRLEGSRKPYIEVLSYRRNNAYMIEIRNSFCGTLQWDLERGLPITSKEQTGGHGYGLSNIQKVARKYSGDIDIVLKDGEFCLCIMMMLVQ